MRPQKLKSYPTYPSASGCADTKTAPDLPKRPVDLFWQNTIFFTFSTKMLSEPEKNGCAFFYSQPRMKVALTCENDRNTSNTGSKS